MESNFIDFDLSNICFEDIQITHVNFDEAVSKIQKNKKI